MSEVSPITCVYCAGHAAQGCRLGGETAQLHTTEALSFCSSGSSLKLKSTILTCIYLL